MSEQEKTVITQQYMDGFQCIGDRCENNCCHGWNVDLDKNSYVWMKKKFQNAPKELKRFKQFVKVKDKNNKRFHASILIKADQSCPYLEDNGLCEIHKRFGETRLSHVCRSYPRRFYHDHGQIELSGSLSCPEVARRALLNKDATALTSIPFARIQKLTDFYDQWANLDSEHYTLHREPIRQIMMLIAAAEGYSIEERLNLIIHFASNLDPFIYKGCPAFPDQKLQEALLFDSCTVFGTCATARHVARPS